MGIGKQIILKISIAIFVITIFYVSGNGNIYVYFGVVTGVFGWEVIKVVVKKIFKK